MTDLEIRPFSERDYAGACLLEEERSGSRYASAVFVRQAAVIFPSFFFIAAMDREVVGYGIGALNQEDRSEGWILRLRVREAYRGKGIGGKVLRRVVSSLTRAGAERIFLSVAPGNDSARRLYRKSGFRESEVRPSYFGAGEDRIIMVTDACQAVDSSDDTLNGA